MNLYAKIIFFLIIFTVFSLTYIFEKSNTTRAIQKILVLGFSVMMFYSIIAPATFLNGIATFMGVGRGADAILYLYIVISLAINFILFKKVSEVENRISKITQSIALDQFIKN